jgi:M-phase inducer tyrosine phosphatase
MRRTVKYCFAHRVKEDGLMRVDFKTVDDLLDGVYSNKLAAYHIIDCRFDYKYNGGHIPSAININTTSALDEFLLGKNVIKPKPSTSGDSISKTVLIFHCEFSAKRAPTFAKHIRSKDCAMNNHVYLILKFIIPKFTFLKADTALISKAPLNAVNPQGDMFAWTTQIMPRHEEKT